MWGLRVCPTHGVIHTLSQNSKGEKRGKVEEVIITNYQTELNLID